MRSLTMGIFKSFVIYRWFQFYFDAFAKVRFKKRTLPKMLDQLTSLPNYQVSQLGYVFHNLGRLDLTSGLCKHCAKSLQSCLTLCDPMDYRLPVFSVHEILQAKILEWAAISFSRGYECSQSNFLFIYVCIEIFSISSLSDCVYPSS